MRLLRQSPQELVLLHRPVVLCAALVALTLALLAVTLWNLWAGEWVKAGVGLLSTAALAAPALWFAAERVDVRFDAVSGQCTISTRRLNGSLQEVYTLDQIDRAMVETHKGPSDTAGAHRVALVLSPGRTEDRRPLTKGYASGRWAKDLTERINRWLADHRGTHAS